MCTLPDGLQCEHRKVVSSVKSEAFKVKSEEVSVRVDSVMVMEKDTLLEVTTITIDRNERGGHAEADSGDGQNPGQGSRGKSEATNERSGAYRHGLCRTEGFRFCGDYEFHEFHEWDSERGNRSARDTEMGVLDTGGGGRTADCDKDFLEVTAEKWNVGSM